eukprot:757588-Hanusia_phi.AAC.4
MKEKDGKIGCAVFRTIWIQSTWVELGTLSYLACLTGVTQFILFFWLMYDWPGVSKYLVMDPCEQLRYISENIELNKGKASVMILTILPSWVVLGIINAYERPLIQELHTVEGDKKVFKVIDRWLSRPLVNFLAVVAYTGCVGVVLFDQQISKVTEEQDRQHDMHILSAFMLSLSYVVAHIITTWKLQKEFNRLGLVHLFHVTYNKLWFLHWFCFFFAIADAIWLAAYVISYLSGLCNDFVVTLEYMLYLFTAVFNIFLYLQFTTVHVLAKIDFGRVYTQ